MVYGHLQHPLRQLLAHWKKQEEPDEDGVELSSDEEEGTVVEDAGSLVSAVVLSFEDSAVDSLLTSRARALSRCLCC